MYAIFIEVGKNWWKYIAYKIPNKTILSYQVLCKNKGITPYAYLEVLNLVFVLFVLILNGISLFNNSCILLPFYIQFSNLPKIFSPYCVFYLSSKRNNSSLR